MGAGVPQSVWTRKKRERLQALAKEYDGVYVPARSTGIGGMKAGGAIVVSKTGSSVMWNATAAELHASNGEGCFLFKGWRAPDTFAENIAYRELMKELGIKPVVENEND